MGSGDVDGFANAVLGTILMWWIYFDTGAKRATKRIERADDPGREARSAYTYVHALIVGGIIACAVADELVIAHPHHAKTLDLAIILGGPMLYLVGNATFKWITNDRRAPPLSHLVGLGLLVLLAWPTAMHALTPLHPGAARERRAARGRGLGVAGGAQGRRSPARRRMRPCNQGRRAQGIR
jgi:low temperature requirement protein LtrA